MDDEGDPMGWWVISGEELLAVLRRVSEGEDPELAYTELYANSRIGEKG